MNASAESPLRERTANTCRVSVGVLGSLAVVISGAFRGPVFGSPPMDLRIDHVSFCGSALAPMEQAFADEGLPTVYGGPFVSGDVHVALLGFGDGSSIELTAPREANLPAGYPWRRAIAGDAGPCAWSVRSGGIERDLERFRSLRVRIGAPRREGRTNPDTTVTRWRTAAVGAAPPGSVFPLLVEDESARETRIRPSSDAAGAGLLGIDAVVVAVRRIDRAVALFRRVYGWGRPEIRTDDFFGATLAYFPGEPVVLAAPRRVKGSWIAYRRKRFGDGPAAILLSARDFDPAVKGLGLTGETAWFGGRRAAWFPSTRLRGARVGIVAPGSGR